MSEHHEPFFMDLSIGSIIPVSTYLDGINAVEILTSNEIFIEHHHGNERIRTLSSEGIVIDQHEGVVVEPQPPEAADIMIEQSISHEELNNDNLLVELLGHEEVWFEQTSQSEEFWLEQIPDNEDDLMSPGHGISSQQLQSTPEAVCFDQSQECVPETQNGSRSTDSTGSIDCVMEKIIGMSQHNTVFECANNKTATSIVINKGACDNLKMFVTPKTKRLTKKLCCPFCLKLVSKLSRHMLSMHKDKKSVNRFMHLPKSSKERRAIQDTLRKEGTVKWNNDFELNKGSLIVSRRPNENLNKLATDYTVCPYCTGYYTKTNLRHHAAVCKVNPERKNRILKKLAAMVEGRIHSDASTRLVFVISFMREDAIVRDIRYDWLLIVFGNKMCCKYTPHYQENMIRARLRLMGRLLHEIKKIDSNVSDFASIYHVERYGALVTAIKVIGRFDPETNEFGAPAMASCAVTFVKLIGKYLAAEYIRLRDPENKIETNDFLTYMETDIGISINKLVTETQAKMRRRKQENIPTMDDVKMLMGYVNVQLKNSYEALSKGFSKHEWMRLANFIAAWIIVFNRRRVGEVQNISVEEFLSRQSIGYDSNEQMMSTLSEDAKKIARKFKRMKIRGKLGRTVPVLLKPIVDKAINLLLSYRQEIGISTDRQFLFELPSSCAMVTKVVNACEVLRNLSVLCGARNPSSLRGTTLRKHMATKCISLELNDTLVSEVANFMGHAKEIHHEFYRKNPLEREVLNIVPVLEAAVGQDLDDDDDDGHLCDDNEQCGCAVRPNSSNVEVVNQPVNLDANEPVKLVTNDNDMMMDDPELRIDFDNGGYISKMKYTKKRWSQEEIQAVYAAFPQHFIRKSLPTPQEIAEQKGKYSALRQRTWQQIKTWISNQYKSKK